MRRLALPLVLTFVTMDLIIAVLTQLPFANGPAEWEWAYRAPGLEGLGLLIAAAAMMALVWWAAQDKASDARWALPLLVSLGWVLTLDVARAQPGGFRQVMESLASRHTFGYVFDEGLAPKTRALLADYPAATAKLNQHARTHPPGALLAVRGLDLLGRRLPPPAAGSGSLGDMARESLDQEAQRARVRHQPSPLTRPAPGTLALLALLLPAFSALAAWPLYHLARRLGLSPNAGLLAAALWLVVPARSLFTPSLDQALPFFLLVAAVLAAGPGRWRAFAAGLCLFLCLFVSYGYLAAAALVGLLILAPIAPIAPVEGTAAPNRATLPRAALLAAGFLLPWIALAVFAGYDPWTSFREAMTQHRAIAVTPRSYSTWLVWNPYDLVLLLGVPVVGLAAAALRPRGDRSRALLALAWGWWALLAVLLVSGTVRGEVGRIWLMLMPFACLLAAAAAVERWSPRSAWAGFFLLVQAALLLVLAANMTFMG
jgi:hypothetical protein